MSVPKTLSRAWVCTEEKISRQRQRSKRGSETQTASGAQLQIDDTGQPFYFRSSPGHFDMNPIRMRTATTHIYFFTNCTR